MTSYALNQKRKQTGMGVARIVFAGLVGLIAGADVADAGRLRSEQAVVSRPAGKPIMAIVSLINQQITVYDDKGWIMRAPVSTGQKGRETPAGIFTVLQKDAEHYSNVYDDAYMPHMQRITWSGIALHGGVLPGHAASHGCIRMPYDFARHLFGRTRLGMRVIVAPGNAVPVAIADPALLQPKTGAVAAAAAAAKAAANEAASKADKARLEAMAAYREWTHAMMPVRKIQNLKLRAESELVGAERAVVSAGAPEANQQIEDTKTRLSTRISELDAELVVGKAALQPKLEAMAVARDAARAAERERVIAEEAARKAARDFAPLSVFISRKTQRLYVRQALQPILEVPVTIQDADGPIGTHVFTATERTSTGIRWSVVSLVGGRSDSNPNTSVRTDPEGAKAALNRIIIPQDTRDFIAERLSPPSSFIISDEALSSETGPETEFVVLLSGQPQGGIKHRRPSPRIGARYGYWPRF
jgi:hypothetical protein